MYSLDVLALKKDWHVILARFVVCLHIISNRNRKIVIHYVSFIQNPAMPTFNELVYMYIPCLSLFGISITQNVIQLKIIK